MADRPDFNLALAHWQGMLAQPEIKWVFRENLCLKEDKDGYKILYETTLRAVSEEDVRRVYDKSAGYDVVFSCLSQMNGYSLCTLLGDPWDLDLDDPASGDQYIAEWDLYFNPASPYRAKEIDHLWEWRKQKLFECRKLSGLDFVYSLSLLKLK